jgi:hypothetical protein
MYRSTAAILVLGLVPCANALQTVGSSPGGGSGVNMQAGAIGAPTYTRTAIADWTGDSLPDYCVRDRDSIVMLYNPAIYISQVRVTDQANDMATLPSPLGEPPSLVVACPQGLEEFRWIAGQTSPPFWDRRFLSTIMAWRSVERIQVYGQGDSVAVYGLNPDGVTLQKLTFTGGVWQHQTLFPVTGLVKDFRPFAPYGEEVWFAVMTPNTLLLYDDQGVLRDSYTALPVTSAAIERVSMQSIPGAWEWILWVLTGPTGSYQYLASFGDTGAGTDVPGFELIDFFPGNPNVVSLQAADLDGDGDLDITGNHKLAEQFFQVMNTGSTRPDFDIMGPTSLFVTYGTPGQQALFNGTDPALLDLDNDGDADCVHPVESRASQYVYKSDFVDENRQEPAVQMSVDPQDPSRLVGEIQLVPMDDDLEITFTCDAEEVPDAADEVELVIYEVSWPEGVTQNQPVARARQDVPAAFTTFSIQAQIIDPEFVLTPGVQFEQLYFCCLRYLDVHPDDGTVLEIFPTAVYGIEASEDPAHQAIFAEHGGGTVFSLGGSLGLERGGDQVGSGSETECLPNNECDAPPPPAPPSGSFG